MNVIFTFLFSISTVQAIKQLRIQVDSPMKPLEFQHMEYDTFFKPPSDKIFKNNHRLVETNSQFALNITRCDAAEIVCNRLGSLFSDVFNRLSQAFLIKRQIFIQVRAYDFCKENSVNCNILGIGSAAAYHFGRFNDADQFSAFPQALVKQLNVNSTLEFSEADILIDLNSPKLTWFPQDSRQILPNETDFRWTIAHELTHGLGFLSLWTSSADNSFMTPLPNFSDSLQSPRAILSPSFNPMQVFDKFLFSNAQNVSLSSFADQIYTFSAPNGTLEPQFYNIFKQTPTFQAAKDVNAIINGGPKTVAFRTRDQSLSCDQKITLATFNSFMPTSSLSHLDYDLYANTPDHLMVYKSDAVIGKSLDDFIASVSSKGPTFGVYGKLTLEILTTMGWPTVLSDNQNVLKIASGAFIDPLVNSTMNVPTGANQCPEFYKSSSNMLKPTILIITLLFL